MEISPLLLKVFGVGTVAVVGTGGVYVYRKEIFGSKGTELKIDDLEEKIKKSADKTDGWTIEDKTSEQKLIIKDTASGGDSEKIKDCTISLKSNSTLKNVLEGKIKTTSPTENNKKYRRGLLRKCSQNNWNLDENNKELKELFDFSKEALTNEETGLKAGGTWSVASPTIETENKKVKVTITVTNGGVDANNISVGSCKIMGTKDENTALSSDKTTSIQTSIQTSINNKLNPTETSSNKETWRENFLKKCKKSYDEEIHLTLSENPSNNYKLDKLDELFDGTL